MNQTKKNIVQVIAKNTAISTKDSAILLDFFLILLKTKARSNVVKLSNFGTFSIKKTPKRVGRNPKTLDSYIINEQYKLNFKTSNKIKKIIN